MHSTALLFLVVLSSICNVINSKSFADPLENNSANSSDIADNYIALLLEINQPGKCIVHTHFDKRHNRFHMIMSKNHRYEVSNANFTSYDMYLSYSQSG